MTKDDTRVTKGEERVTATALGEVIGLSTQHVGRLAKEGLPKGPDGKYALAPAIKWFVDYRVRQATADQHDEDSSKARILASKAKLEELKLARELGKTITVDFALDRIAPFLSSLRAQLLALPKKVAPVLTDGMTAGEREAVMTKAIHDALRELSTLPDRLREDAPIVEEVPEDDSEDE